ncbi:SLC4A10 [Symbiodinium sp. KB8]|nr:SLC4A10 [Symbiodinium sp. KB8]
MAEEDDSRQEDLIFFEPAMETLSDMANDDDELPKGISKAKRAAPSLSEAGAVWGSCMGAPQQQKQ